jgi:hypothetical protein
MNKQPGGQAIQNASNQAGSTSMAAVQPNLSSQAMNIAANLLGGSPTPFLMNNLQNGGGQMNFPHNMSGST